MKIYCLMFPTTDGLEQVHVHGSECSDRGAADLLHGDRVANGHAFRGEYVAVVRYAEYLRAFDRHVPMRELP